MKRLSYIQDARCLKVKYSGAALAAKSRPDSTREGGGTVDNGTYANASDHEVKCFIDLTKHQVNTTSSSLFFKSEVNGRKILGTYMKFDLV